MDIKREKISVIVPCFNVEHVIDRCLNSIVHQSIGLEALEIILVDDASTDDTYDKLLVWEHKFPDNIMLIHCQENGKQGTARNIGMSYATGDYIGFVDADDWIDEKMYETLYQAITEYSCEIASVLYQKEDNTGKVYQTEQSSQGTKKEYQYNQRYSIQTSAERKKFLRKGNMPGGVWSKLYRKDFLEQQQIFFPEQLFYEDNFWAILLSYVLTSYVVIDKKLYHYVANENSTTTGLGARHLDRLKVEMMLVEELQKRGYEEEFHDEIESRFLQSYWCMMLKRLFLQFPVIPYDILDVMRETVKNWFPDYLYNPYIADFDETEKMFLRMIEIEMDQKQIDQFADMYRKAFVKDAIKMYQ